MYRKILPGILSICLGCFGAFGLDFTGVHGDSGDYSATKSFSTLSDNDISGSTSNGWIFETGTVSGNSGASTITIKEILGVPRSSHIQTYTTPGRRFNYLNFTLRVSGKLNKPGPEPGTMPNYLLTGNRGGSFLILPIMKTVPQGTSALFEAIEYFTGQGSPTAAKLCDWTISPATYKTLGEETSVSGLIDRTSITVGGSEWPHPDAGSYVISAVLSSSSERSVKSAALTIVGVQKVEATYDGTTVTSTTASPGTAQTIYIPVGESVTVTATPTPATWPSGYPTWKVNGTSAGTAGSATYELSPDTAGTYTVSATCGTSTKAIKVVVWEVISETVATFPADRTRKTIGIGEEVNLSTNPSMSVAWSVVGGGSISSATGVSTVFTASKSPTSSTVKATMGTYNNTLLFTVIAPTGFDVSIQSSPGLGTLGNNQIGQRTLYNVEVVPASVSFYSVEFREFFTNTTWTWPNGLVSNFGPAPIPWSVNYRNLTYDDISDGPFPKNRIYDQEQASYVNFSYTIIWKEQYKNEAGAWVDFFTGETTVTEYEGSTLKCRTTNRSIPGLWQGPWQ